MTNIKHEITSIYQCDGCLKEEDSKSEDVPDGWVTAKVIFDGYKMGIRHMHICRECYMQFYKYETPIKWLWQRIWK